MRWLIGIVAILGLAFALQAGLVAFAGYVLLGVFFLSRYLAKEWITNVEAERQCNEDPQEVGGQTQVIVTIRNKGRWPICWLLIEDLLPARSLK